MLVFIFIVIKLNRRESLERDSIWFDEAKSKREFWYGLSFQNGFTIGPCHFYSHDSVSVQRTDNLKVLPFISVVFLYPKRFVVAQIRMKQ